MDIYTCKAIQKKNLTFGGALERHKCLAPTSDLIPMKNDL
jgi:hypothetical protein